MSAIYNFVLDESLRQITLNSLASVICGICEICGYLLSSVFGLNRPPREKDFDSASSRFDAPICSATGICILNSCNSCTPELLQLLTSRTARLFFRPPELRQYTEIFKCCGVSCDLTSACNFLEQSAHDFSASSLWQGLGETNIVWFSDRSDRETDV